MLLHLRDRSGLLLPTPAEAKVLRAAETRRADAEARRAESAEARVAALEAELIRFRQGN
jgi:hypothetical protein